MSFFFVETPLAIGTSAEISGDAAHHIAGVRRMKPGNQAELQDPSGARYVAEIVEVGKRSLTITPLRTAPLPLPPERRVTLLQAYIAEQKLDLVLQKATELGAARIIVWQAEYSPHEISAERLAHKTERFVAILKNACEQSGRPDVPQLDFASTLEAALSMYGGASIVALDAGGADAIPNGPLALVVGPEGGFGDSERRLRDAHHIPTVSLGAYTLRAETAAIAGLARVV